MLCCVMRRIEDIIPRPYVEPERNRFSSWPPGPAGAAIERPSGAAEPRGTRKNERQHDTQPHVQPTVLDQFGSVKEIDSACTRIDPLARNSGAEPGKAPPMCNPIADERGQHGSDISMTCN